MAKRNPEIYVYPTPTFGRILLEYSPGEEAGLETLTAREVVATYAIEEQRVPVDVIERAKAEMEEMASREKNEDIKDVMQSLADNLDYLARSAREKSRKHNPVQATKLSKQLSRQSAGKARRGAKSSARHGSIAKKVRGARVSSALAKLNPQEQESISKPEWDRAFWEGYDLAANAYNDEVWLLPDPEPALIRGTADEAARRFSYAKQYIPAIEEGIVSAKRELMIASQSGFVGQSSPPSPDWPMPNPKKKRGKKKQKARKNPILGSREADLFNSVAIIITDDIKSGRDRYVGIDEEDAAEEVLYKSGAPLPLNQGPGVYDAGDLELATTAVIDARYRYYKGIARSS